MRIRTRRRRIIILNRRIPLLLLRLLLSKKRLRTRRAWSSSPSTRINSNSKIIVVIIPRKKTPSKTPCGRVQILLLQTAIRGRRKNERARSARRRSLRGTPWPSWRCSARRLWRWSRSFSLACKARRVDYKINNKVIMIKISIRNNGVTLYVMSYRTAH